MWPLPVSDLFFVGRATTKKLYNLGITTIGQLATSDINILRYHLKKQGEIVYNFANGIDDSDVIRSHQRIKDMVTVLLLHLMWKTPKQLKK